MTRCSVALADPADLMEAFQLLTSQESQDKLNYKIVRFKNKFEPKSKDTFKNIMVNALVRGEVLVMFRAKRSVTVFVPSKAGDQWLSALMWNSWESSSSRRSGTAPDLLDTFLPVQCVGSALAHVTN